MIMKTSPPKGAHEHLNSVRNDDQDGARACADSDTYRHTVHVIAHASSVRVSSCACALPPSDETGRTRFC